MIPATDCEYKYGTRPADTFKLMLPQDTKVGDLCLARKVVRVIAATNRDLQAAVSAGSFRSDLYYRLHVFPIEIPALRERKEDIPLQVEYFIDRYARKAGRHFRSVQKRTLQVLQSYPWPGNIRELQNVIERSVIVRRGLFLWMKAGSPNSLVTGDQQANFTSRKWQLKKRK